MELIDLTHYEQDFTRYYGGAAGAKYALIINGEPWLVKFPSPVGGPNDQPASRTIRQYTTSPLSEYLGSQIYTLLGVPTHETMLGFRNGKIVVACKDFDPDHNLVEFGQIKNSLVESDAGLRSSSSSSTGEYLDDALAVIKAAPILQATPGVEGRFWDMFLIDAFIRNADRNNANWGVLLGVHKEDEHPIVPQLVPVYDNGNAFFQRRASDVLRKRLSDQRLVREDAIGTERSFYLDDLGRHIHPFQLISSGRFEGLTNALGRFMDRFDRSRIHQLIEEVPEHAFGLPVMSSSRKEFYIQLLDLALDEVLIPAARRLL